MAKLTVSKRLTLGFGICFLLLVFAFMLAISRLDALNATVSRMAAEDWPRVVTANKMAMKMNDNARATFELILGGDPASIGARIDANKAAITQQMEFLERNVASPAGKALLVEIKQKRKTYVESFSHVVEIKKSGDMAESISVMLKETTPALGELLTSVDNFVQVQGSMVDAAAKDAHSVYQGAWYTMIFFLLATVLVTLVLATWIIRSITRPLGGEPDAVAEVARRIAKGDLSVAVEVKAGDTTSLVAAMSAMQEGIRGMVVDFQQNAEQVSDAAQQLSATARQVATGTETQSEAAASVAAAVEEMTVSVAQVSSNTAATLEVTGRVGTLSIDGRRVIEGTVSEIKGIADTVGNASQTIFTMGENADRITGVVQVIKEIADQTNLLALNAAIEAARAGEQGRGFAVVADEVRKLAERTAQATTEIREMTDGIYGVSQQAVAEMHHASERVDTGVKLAQQADQAMNDISNGAQNVVASVKEISSALREQGSAVNQIAANVEKIAQMAEENSAAAGQTAATAGELEILAAKARTSVSRFRLIAQFS